MADKRGFVAAINKLGLIIMIRIINLNNPTEILIDDSHPNVTVHPREYESDPSIEIFIKGFNFLNHSTTCSDCSAFIEDLGSKKLDWIIEFFGKRFIIEMSRKVDKGYSSNQLGQTKSEYKRGSTIKLFLSQVDFDLTSAHLLKEANLVLENYERACHIHDFILKSNLGPTPC